MSNRRIFRDGLLHSMAPSQGSKQPSEKSKMARRRAKLGRTTAILRAHRDAMTKLRVLSFGLSIDGYGAGPRQDLKNPLGVGDQVLLDWSRASRTFRKVHGAEGGDESGVDEEFGGAWSPGHWGVRSWAVTCSACKPFFMGFASKLAGTSWANSSSVNS